MYVITVTPLIRGTALDTLTYYSSTAYEIGSFVTIPIRGGEKPGIVVEVKSVGENKSSLKSASFSLRRLPPDCAKGMVPAPLRAAAAALTEQYPSSLGGILYQLLPPDVRSGQYNLPMSSSLTQHEDTTPQLLTATQKERYVFYRSHIRGVLARRGSVLFVVPTGSEVAYAAQQLKQGIEDRVVVFSPHQNKKERQDAYQAFEDTTRAQLIITTPTHAYLDRVDLLSIVIEASGSEHYVSRERPYLDHRVVLAVYAKCAGRSLLLGDMVPRTEDEYARRSDRFSTFNEETKRLAFPAPLTVVQMKDVSTPEAPFALFSPTLKTRINHVLEAKGRVFLYGARRGLAPVVTCVDCGYIFRCPDSDTPYSLLRTVNSAGVEERFFISGASGKKVRAADTCTACGSWRLRGRGIGIQHVFDECQQLFPKNTVVLFDHQTASTHKRAEAIVKQFYATRSAIMVGSATALPFLASQGVDLSAVVSFDATRSIPTWRADEQVFRLLMQLREQSAQEVIVQTRTPPDSVLQHATQGSIELFYTDEIDLRQQLEYPPFVMFVLLTISGAKAAIEQVEQTLKPLLTAFAPHYYSRPTSTTDKITRHALIKCPSKKEERIKLISLLRGLPPYVKIEIDPPRIV